MVETKAEEKEQRLYVNCPRCGVECELRRAVDGGAGGSIMWVAECPMRHQFGVFVDVTSWPTKRVQTPLPMRLAAAD